jgi:putative membrane protein
MTGKHNDPPPDSPRQPRVFKIDDAIVEDSGEPLGEGAPGGGRVTSRREVATETPRRLTANDINRGIRWGSVMLSAMAGLASLAAGLWFTRFVSVALERNDWVGWTATALMGIVVCAGIVLLLRELWGFRRLARLSRLRKDVRQALGTKDPKLERSAVLELVAHYRGRADLSWGLSRLKDHAGDVLAPGELLRLADRELLLPLDGEARRVILKSAKRVATVTALSPMMWIAMLFVAVENISMFRTLAGLYGGRPGVLGALRLGRLVVTHIVATGGVAMTDDLLGQFLGQDVLRRLSRRLGEGAFNGALTARLGVAAVEVTRPLPFLDAEPLRVREILAELMRSLRSGLGKSEPPAA